MLSEQLVGEYLNRIGLHPSQPLPRTKESLFLIHRSHTSHIPFENLNIALQTPILIDTEANLKKFSSNHRGGYCYEMNGSFKEILDYFGFSARFTLATVTYRKNANPFSHIGILVTLNDEIYLCDVSFGGNGLKEPILLQQHHIIQQGTEFFRFVPFYNEQNEKLFDYALEFRRQSDELWKPCYGFSLTREFDMNWDICHQYNQMNQYDKESFFFNNVLVALQTETARVILFNQHFSILWYDQSCEDYKDTVETVEKLKQILETQFQMFFGEQELHLIFEKIRKHLA